MRHDFSATLEELEQRRLLSVGLKSGTLSIAGTSGDDSVSVSLAKRNPGQLIVTMNGQEQTFAASKVKQISVDLLSGNDLLSVDHKHSRIVAPVYAWAARATTR